MESLLEDAEDGAKEGIKVDDQSSQSGRGETGAITDKAQHAHEMLTCLPARAASVVKTDVVKIKTEYRTPGPKLQQSTPSSPSPQGLLDAIRQMKAAKKELRAELQKINSLKRKHQQDDNDSDGSRTPAKRTPAKRAKSVIYAMETDAESEGDSDHGEGASVAAEETEDDG